MEAQQEKVNGHIEIIDEKLRRLKDLKTKAVDQKNVAESAEVFDKIMGEDFGEIQDPTLSEYQMEELTDSDYDKLLGSVETKEESLNNEDYLWRLTTRKAASWECTGIRMPSQC